MISSYFKSLEEKLNQSAWLIEQKSFAIEYDEDANTGLFSGSVTYKDGSVFHFKETLVGETRHYRFHLMDEKNNLIMRWDDAPHHKELRTFPYHVHLPDSVKECDVVTLMQVLDEIEDIVIERLEDRV